MFETLSEDGLIVTGKGNKERAVPLNKILIKYLKIIWVNTLTSRY